MWTLRQRSYYVVLVLGGLAVLAFAFEGCISAPDDWAGKGGPPHVVVSFPPLYSFAKSVGGTHVGIVSVCTDTGPHDYEGTARDKRLVHHADLFFADGLGLEKEVPEKLAGDKAGTPGFLVKLGDHLPPEMVKKDPDHPDEADPHVWLGIPQAKRMVDDIRDNLKRVDPAHAADYDANAAKYQQTLDKLHDYGKKALEGKKDRRIISFHESLNYFADSYGLKIVAVIEDGPGDDPSSTKLAALVEQILKEEIHVIAVEPQYPTSKSADVLISALAKKKYTDIHLVKIDPLETAEEAELSADLYERKVKENIDELAKYLK